MTFKYPLITKRALCALIVFGCCMTWTLQAWAVTLTFDEVIVGETTFEFDADADTLPDAIFSTTDPGGFNTVGPGANMSYIEEPGLEGTNELNPDLRVDFPNGAITSLGFGFAMSAGSESPNLTVTFRIYGSGDNLLASTTELAAYTEPVPPAQSNFPEGQFTLPFAGTASYATFDFNNTDASRYIIDNFTGTFGSTEDVTPPPPPAPPPDGTPMDYAPVPTLSEWGIALFVFAVLLLAGRRFRRI